MYWTYTSTHSLSSPLAHSFAQSLSHYLLLHTLRLWLLCLLCYYTLLLLLCPSKLWFGICRVTVHTHTFQSLSCLFVRLLACLLVCTCVYLFPLCSNSQTSIHTHIIHTCSLFFVVVQLNSVFTIFDVQCFRVCLPCDPHAVRVMITWNWVAYSVPFQWYTRHVVQCTYYIYFHHSFIYSYRTMMTIVFFNRKKI